MEAEILEPQTRILVYEVTEAIGQLTSTANFNANLLNQIQSLSGLKSESEILNASANRKQFILDLFLKKNPDAGKLYAISDTKFKYGSDLLELERLLSQMNLHSFKFVEYRKQVDRWMVDKNDLHNACEKYRRYAETEDQRQRWKFAQQYCDFLTNELKAGPLAMRKFVGEIMVYVPGQGYVPNVNFVTNSYQH